MRLAALFLLAVCAGPAPALAQQSDQARMQSCSDLIDKDPDQAYQEALHWLSQGQTPAARQCAALALIGLGQEEAGALQLQQLANEKDSGSIEQRVVYLAQAGNAWMLAKDPQSAVSVLSAAIKIAPRDAEMHKDRARAFTMEEKWKEASDDLDTAISLSPGDAEALQARAYARLKLNKLPEAFDDVEAALKQSPKDVNIAVLRGDIREAMRKAGMEDPVLKEAPTEARPHVVGN